MKKGKTSKIQGFKTKLMTELKSRKEFTKKSIKRRDEIKKAVYSEQFKKNKNN